MEKMNEAACTKNRVTTNGGGERLVRPFKRLTGLSTNEPPHGLSSSNRSSFGTIQNICVDFIFLC